MHRSARCRWSRYSTRPRAATGERGAVLLVGMEPALGRHELNSLKDKCIFPSYNSLLRIKNWHRYYFGSCLRAQLQHTWNGNLYQGKHTLSSSRSKAIGLCLFQPLALLSEIKSNGFKSFVINAFTIFHGANTPSITRLSRKDMQEKKMAFHMDKHYYYFSVMMGKWKLRWGE